MQAYRHACRHAGMQAGRQADITESCTPWHVFLPTSCHKNVYGADAICLFSQHVHKVGGFQQ